MRPIICCMLACILVLLAAAPAHAYLDPGSMSSVIYVLLAGLAGVAGFVKLYWSKLKGLFRKKDGD